jgi:hypothetical protein
LTRFEFKSGTFWLFYLIFVSLENHVCLSHGVQVTDATWQTVTRIVARVGDLMKRTKIGHTDWVLGDRTIERSGDIVCDLHRTRGDEEREFLG